MFYRKSVVFVEDLQLAGKIIPPYGIQSVSLESYKHFSWNWFKKCFFAENYVYFLFAELCLGVTERYMVSV